MYASLTIAPQFVKKRCNMAAARRGLEAQTSSTAAAAQLFASQLSPRWTRVRPGHDDDERCAVQCTKTVAVVGPHDRLVGAVNFQLQI